MNILTIICLHLKKYLGNIGFNKKCKTKSENGFENETCACMKDNCIRIEKGKWRPIIPTTTTTSSSTTTSKVSISRKIKMIILILQIFLKLKKNLTFDSNNNNILSNSKHTNNNNKYNNYYNISNQCNSCRFHYWYQDQCLGQYCYCFNCFKSFIDYWDFYCGCMHQEKTNGSINSNYSDYYS